MKWDTLCLLDNQQGTMGLCKSVKLDIKYTQGTNKGNAFKIMIQMPNQITSHKDQIMDKTWL